MQEEVSQPNKITSAIIQGRVLRLEAIPDGMYIHGLLYMSPKESIRGYVMFPPWQYNTALLYVQNKCRS